MMPTMAAAYASLSREAVPKATTAINIVRQVGGSLGTAVIAVVLARNITHKFPVAGAGHDFTNSARSHPVPERRRRRFSPRHSARRSWLRWH
jgi:hypothetical protein